MLFHLVYLVLSMRIFIIKHYSTEVEKQNRFYEKNELCINKEVYAKERVERLRRDRVAVICRDSNLVTTVYTVIGNPLCCHPLFGDVNQRKSGKENIKKMTNKDKPVVEWKKENESYRRKKMVKQIVRDIFFLGQPSEPATKADIQVGKDLQDTLQANRERCVGMAANMIGVKKNIIIVNMGFMDVVMFNPVIVSKRDMYETEEGCLSLDGVRKTTRYQEIEVDYYDFNWKKQRQKLSGWTAQICQHEIDHLSGKII